MQDTTQSLDTSKLLDGLGVDTGLIGTMMTIGTIISIVLAVVFVFYVIKNGARRKKSENAMIEMAKDIRDIKTLVEKQTVVEPAPTPPTESTEET